MSSLHWLILIPYYFFTALSLYLAFALVCRFARLSASANPIAIAAVVGALVATAAPLVLDWTEISQYSWQPLVGLFAVSMTLAAIDTALMGTLGIPADAELEDV